MLELVQFLEVQLAVTVGNDTTTVLFSELTFLPAVLWFG